ncbi:hypothetical protein A2Z67_00145 [Candidatus Woesebacteria bacterium RBG_13_36_22]|uniref:Uncharacterized protein n=1 Tax=Candidatus Woesebacteria bacterium RBG_13_36_22 TaxID=1802478 RepID=A0A1F7X6P2_9BACT|nr:MAG: hypothetical protein A2Z67_00145 [Candidatus Woesebacteria bacterium RBG_13_36_22]
MTRHIKTLTEKGWLVLAKSEYFDWYIEKVFASSGYNHPKRKAQRHIKEMNIKWPDVFCFKIKPCMVVY